MMVRAGLLLRVAFGAALAVLAGAGAGAQTAVPGQDEMNVVDQPGYQPSPDEEQLTGAYEKQEVFFRTNDAPGTGRFSLSCFGGKFSGSGGYQSKSGAPNDHIIARGQTVHGLPVVMVIGLPAQLAVATYGAI